VESKPLVAAAAAGAAAAPVRSRWQRQTAMMMMLMMMMMVAATMMMMMMVAAAQARSLWQQLDEKADIWHVGPLSLSCHHLFHSLFLFPWQKLLEGIQLL
jgi:hypothetical protein